MGKKAIIIGGSVGGLFAAHCLRSIGWDVDVYERVTGDLAARGAGLGTHRDLFDIMRRVGITVDDRTGVEVNSRVCLTRSGEIMQEIPFHEFKSSWAAIWRALRVSLPDRHYHQGMAFTGLETNGNGVIATFSDGTTVA